MENEPIHTPDQEKLDKISIPLQKDIEPDIQKVIDENFWDML